MRKLINFISILLVIVSLIFVFEKICSNQIWNAAPHILVRLALGASLGIPAYALGCFLLSSAWWKLLRWLDQPKLSWSTSAAIYGRSQIAKYVPGNVFHLVGRHVYARRVGLEHRFVAWSTMIEFAGLIAAAGSISAIGWAVSADTFSTLGVVLTASLAGAYLVTPFFLNSFLQHIPSLNKLSMPHSRLRVFLTGLWPAYVLYTAFFFVAGLVLCVLLLSTTSIGLDAFFPTLAHLTPVAAFCWLIGFITPGAPAGIGIRDASLILALSQMVSESEATLITMAFRVVTTAGDLGFFLISPPIREAMESCSQESQDMEIKIRG